MIVVFYNVHVFGHYAHGHQSVYNCFKVVFYDYEVELDCDLVHTL